MKNNKTNLLLSVVLIVLASSCASVKKTMWVSGYKTNCDMGAGKGSCLVVNQSPDSKSNKWENFYAPIQGFQFKEGVMQKIRVKETKKDKNSTAQDQSNILYELVKVETTAPDVRNQLQGEWYPATINGNTIAPNDYMPNLNFDLAEKRVFGTDGCNNFNATIKDLSLSILKLSPAAGTKKACPDMTLANLFNTSLASITKYRISDGMLTLIDEFDKDRMTLKRGEGHTPHALSGPWILTRLNGNPLNRKIQLPTLEMNLADRRVFGSDGCNNYTGPLLNAGVKNLEFGVMSSTKKMCTDMGVADKYNEALEKVKSYTLQNNTITLFDAQGTEVLSFIKRN